MSVLCKPGRGADSRRWLILPILVLLFSTGLGSQPIGAQVESEVVAEEAAAVADDLWSAVTERYEVVVLSRGLLLEPLGPSVELVTIEIVDDGIAIDGESVDAGELATRIGEDDAEILTRLAAMDRTARRELFAAQVEEVAELSEEEASEEAERSESRDDERRKYRDSQVAVGSSLTVHEDEVAKEAVVFGGPLFVRGKVDRDAVAIGGSVTVSGQVTGDVAAVGGNLVLEPGAEVEGDVVSVGGEVQIDDDAHVRGQVIEVPFGPNLRFGSWPRVIFGGDHDWRDSEDYFDLSPWSVATDFMWETFKLIVLGLFACLVLLVAREPLERVKRRAASEPWKSGLVGLLVLILFAPLLLLVTLILVISIIGIPLVLLLPFFILALILVAFLGFSGVAMGIGELLKGRFGWKIESPYLVLLLGVLTLQIWSILADLLDFGWGPFWFFAVILGIFGALVKFFAWTVGLGAAVLTRFGTSDGWGDRGDAIYPPAVPAAPVPPDASAVAPESQAPVSSEQGFAADEPSYGEFDPSPEDPKPPNSGEET